MPRASSREAAPTVGAGAGAFPSIGAELFAAGDGVEAPKILAGANVEAEDIAVEAGGDEDVFEDDTGGGGAGGDDDATGGAEGVEGRASFRIQCVEPIAGADEEAGGIFGVAGPVEETTTRGDVLKAVGVLALDHRAAPKLAAGGSVESDKGFAGSRGVEDAVDDDGRALDVGGAVTRAEGPRDGEVADVGAVDLRKRRVATRAVVALGAGPAGKCGEG